MSSSNKSWDRVPFKDVSSTCSTGALQCTPDARSNTPGTSHTPTLDAKELKKQRDRERYARNKDEILRKRRERYHQKKEEANLQRAKHAEANATKDIAELQDENRTIRKDTIAADENNDWLHKNDSYVRPSDLTYESMFGDVGTTSILMHHDDSTPTSKILEDFQEPIINKSETHDGHVND
ncbi:hypothetical protein ACP4OV_001227 [Aristida adscensionis]